MPVVGLDHVNIQTRDVPGAARFYAELLGLEPRNAPSGSAPDRVQWLHDDTGRPILHVGHADRDPGSTGPIHHVALACSGKAEIIERLERSGAHYDVHENESAGLTQIFTTDPQGILLELNFADG